MYWEDALHSLKGAPHVVDIRNVGLVGAAAVSPRDGAVGARAYDLFVQCFEDGLLVRQTGDTIALSPPLIIDKTQIDQIVNVIGTVLKRLK